MPSRVTSRADHEPSSASPRGSTCRWRSPSGRGGNRSDGRRSPSTGTPSRRAATDSARPARAGRRGWARGCVPPERSGRGTRAGCSRCTRRVVDHHAAAVGGHVHALDAVRQVGERGGRGHPGCERWRAVGADSRHHAIDLPHAVRPVAHDERAIGEELGRARRADAQELSRVPPAARAGAAPLASASEARIRASMGWRMRLSGRERGRVGTRPAGTPAR